MVQRLAVVCVAILALGPPAFSQALRSETADLAETLAERVDDVRRRLDDRKEPRLCRDLADLTMALQGLEARVARGQPRADLEASYREIVRLRRNVFARAMRANGPVDIDRADLAALHALMRDLAESIADL